MFSSPEKSRTEQRRCNNRNPPRLGRKKLFFMVISGSWHRIILNSRLAAEITVKPDPGTQKILYSRIHK